MNLKHISIAVCTLISCAVLSGCFCEKKSEGGMPSANPAKADSLVNGTFAARDAVRANLKAQLKTKKPEVSAEQKKYDETVTKRINEANKILWTKDQEKALKEFDAIYNDKKASSALRYSVIVPQTDALIRAKRYDEAAVLIDKCLANPEPDFAVSEVKPALLSQKARLLDIQRKYRPRAEVLMERLGTNISDKDVFRQKREVLYNLRRGNDYVTAYVLAQELFASAKSQEEKIDAADEIFNTVPRLNDYKKLRDAADLCISVQPDINKKAEMNLRVADNIRHGAMAKPALALQLRMDAMKDASLSPELRVKGYHAVCTSHVMAVHSSMDKSLVVKYFDEYIRPIKDLPARQYGIAMRDLIQCTRFFVHKNGDAKKYAESMLVYPDMSLDDKIFAKITLAEIAAEERQFVQAEKIIDSAFAYEKLSHWPVLNLCKTKAKILSWQEKCDEAVAFLKKHENTFPYIKSSFAKEIADTYLYFCRYEEAAKAYLDRGYPIEAARAVQDRLPDLSRKIALQALTDETLSVSARETAASWFVSSSKEDKALRAKYPLIFKKSTSVYDKGVVRAIMYGDAEAMDEFATNRSADPEFVMIYRDCDGWMQALAKLHKYDKAEALAKSIAARKDEDALKIPLIFAGFAVKAVADKPGAIEAFYKAYKFPAGTTEKTKSEALKKAGLVLYMAGKNLAAQEAVNTYTKLFKDEPRKEYNVKFFDEPIRDMNGFLAILKKTEKQEMNRKYGGNMDFLVTDVTTGDRGTAITNANTAAKYTPCEMYAACDEFGLHLLFRIHDSKAADVEAGTLGAGSFEMYLAPGENQPYNCFLPNLEKGTCGIYQTTYTNAQWRMLKENVDVVSQQKYLPDGYIFYMFISWTKFYDKLPECKADFWEFENIFWSRFGGYSWNGIRNIHGRSTFGLLRFDISQAQLRNVKKHIIYAAKQAYQREDRTNYLHHGIVDIMKKDTVFGDQVFYKSKIAPITEKLEADMKLITADMTDATIDKLFNEDVPGWFGIRYIISAERTKYLQEKFSK